MHLISFCQSFDGFGHNLDTDEPVEAVLACIQEAATDNSH
jgi:hypothetical protein